MDQQSEARTAAAQRRFLLHHALGTRVVQTAAGAAGSIGAIGWVSEEYHAARLEHAGIRIVSIATALERGCLSGGCDRL